jgi:hypothetical protein
VTVLLGIFVGYLYAAALVDQGRAAAIDDSDPAGWRETGLYRLRFEGVRTCAQPASAATINGGPAAKVWMGFQVQAVARVNELYVTARDFSLERGGIIVQARHVNTPLLARCLPLLQRRQLRANQSARGFVLFEVPARFRDAGADLVLAYRPTRWGGAPRAEFRLQPCLDSCSGADRAEVAGPRSNSGDRKKP